MALQDDESPTRHGSSPGGILGERYQIREVLGRGGMGEVYRAFDLKLRVDVALKAVRPELSTSEKARELLRQEVRSAREVVSPNVCRIFDLVVEEGRELVSMEYIDGTTLAETLRERGPLELREAREIAAQFLSGLEAIHEAGLVHRDFKPENVMLTRAGRVVVMDFGLAKARSEEKSRTIAGTPAYMSPEQSLGEPVDARSDVFSSGVVLAEMLWDGPRAAVWDAVRETPPRVPESPWGSVLRQALASDRESRHPTARALARALDEVTHRIPGFEDKHPYPGLASFSQEDAEYFFGREMEVEAVWKKLKRPRLLALIGPSGAGKSSFLRAGLLPTIPPGWSVVLSTPGHRPFSALAESLLPAFAGDMPAIQSFLRFDEPETAVSLFSAWRRRSEHSLVIVDQFEELFTLNPPEVQEAFAELLGRLVLDADVQVLLSLRDDFLFHCQKYDALGPVFSELTPLGTLSPSALRRALVQPALACGYRFEDESLVEEMVSEVSRERGALPLLAFAASRLWEKRDRERGFLTREAYQEIGGVGGSLAQHAEETLSRIGAERTPIVRELFRNLVTAQGTRANREVEELLSIFPNEDERKAAEEVLRELVAARLLTSYETSVEIIHESLLSAWPRLIQWRHQDEGGALLRDQLRQAAQAWQDRGRPDDLLWTGKSYRELSLWRESYPGGLSSVEEGFAAAAKKLAGRTRRRRRFAFAALVAAVSSVALATSFLWRRSEEQMRRAQAAGLVILAREQLDENNTGALAYATASLELADRQETRRLALESLWRGPTFFSIPRQSTYAVESSDPLVTATVLADNRSLRMQVAGFGEMVFELFDFAARRATDHVVQLADSGFYNGVSFHRVIDNFVIQGGDPTGTGSGGSPLGDFDDQFHVDLQHNRTGILSMAKSFDDTNDSQFFITEGPQRHLDFNHTIFGILVEGESVRQAISNVPVGAEDRPVTAVVIETARSFVDEENAVVLLKAPERATGAADVTLVVRNSSGQEARQTFRVNVIPDAIDSPPFLADIPEIRTRVDASVTYQLQALDVEDASSAKFLDQTGLLANGLSVPIQTPASLQYQVDFNTGLLTVTPTNGLTGRHFITVATGVSVNAVDYQVVPVTIEP